MRKDKRRKNNRKLWERNGQLVKFIKTPMSKFVTRKITFRHIHQYAFYLQQHGHPQLIFDIGANQGLYTLFFAACFPDSEIHSFEPVKETYGFLKQNMRLNPQLSQRITAHNHGFWSADEHKSMGMPANDQQWNTGRQSIFGTHYETEGHFKILDEWCLDSNIYPSFIKIDTEGAEYHILNKGRKCLENTRYVICEHHTAFKDSEMLDELFIECGFHRNEQMSKRRDFFWEK